ncbi:MAG: pentapeptide repeat-containing protein [Halobacteriota archaeon]
MATCRHDECSEAVCGHFAWCILHLDSPKGDDPEFTRIRDEKLLKTKEKIKAGDLNFEGTNIYDVDASDVSIPGRNNAIFKNATIKGRVRFEKTKIETSVWFEGAKIEKNASFAGAEIGGDVRFEAAEIGEDAWFRDAQIGADVRFEEARIAGDVRFEGAKVSGDALFEGAQIRGTLNLI